MDKHTTVEELKDLAKKFVEERDWVQFLYPKTISMGLSVEAAELLEKFLFVSDEESKAMVVERQDEIEQELADVFYWILQMSWIYNIDISEAVRNKMHMNGKKYPVEKARGNTAKYNKL